MIQTSYFSSKAPRECKVSIAKWPPRFWKGARANRLAPSDPKAENWAERYRQDLEERFPDAESLRDYLAAIESQTPDPILCCFESDPEQCHRRVLAAYIKELLDINVPEWKSHESSQSNFMSEKQKKQLATCELHAISQPEVRTEQKQRTAWHKGLGNRYVLPGVPMPSAPLKKGQFSLPGICY